MLFFTVYKYSAKVQIKSKTTKNNVISPAGASLQLVPNSQFTILSPSYLSHLSHPSHNSKFRIQNSLPVPQSPPHTQLHAFAGFGSPSQPSQPSHTSHTSHLPHTCIVLIVSLIFLTTHLIHYPLSF